MSDHFTDRLGLDWLADDEEDEQISGALELTLDNVVSWLAVKRLGLGDDAERFWHDRMYDELRDLLPKQHLLRAVLTLVLPYAEGIAEVTVEQFSRLQEPRQGP